MKQSPLARMVLAAGFGLAVLWMATEAPAQELTDEQRDCVRACRDSSRDCRSDVRAAQRTCFEDAGCDVLRDDYRDTCFVVDRDDEACDAARTDLRECVAPCRETARADGASCRETIDACLSDECGIDELPERPRRGRGFRGPGARAARDASGEPPCPPTRS